MARCTMAVTSTTTASLSRHSWAPCLRPTEINKTMCDTYWPEGAHVYCCPQCPYTTCGACLEDESTRCDRCGFHKPGCWNSGRCPCRKCDISADCERAPSNCYGPYRAVKAECPICGKQEIRVPEDVSVEVCFVGGAPVCKACLSHSEDTGRWPSRSGS